MDGPGGKWTVQLGESGRSKAPKVDGPGSKWTVRKDIKLTVCERGGPKHESGRSTKNETGRFSKVRGLSKREESGRSVLHANQYYRSGHRVALLSGP